ncbi:MAG: hypothetical protein RL701_3656 [Pseudomonadota bacterium]
MRDSEHGSRMTAVRSVLLQSSLDELKHLGHFERYLTFMDPVAFEELSGLVIGPGWIPAELALKHYAACDAMLLTHEQLEAMGTRVSARLHSTLLVTVARSMSNTLGGDPWTFMGPLTRLAGRVFQGTRAEIIKLGPKDMRIDVRGNTLFQFQYYRVAYSASLRARFTGFGARIVYVKFAPYNEDNAFMAVRVSWA